MNFSEFMKDLTTFYECQRGTILVHNFDAKFFVFEENSHYTLLEIDSTDKKVLDKIEGFFNYQSAKEFVEGKYKELLEVEYPQPKDLLEL